jgi:hypothetical protein
MKLEIFDVGCVGIVSDDESVPALYSDRAAAARPLLTIGFQTDPAILKYQCSPSREYSSVRGFRCRAAVAF